MEIFCSVYYACSVERVCPGTYAASYDVQDSSVIPAKRLPQHTEFMANNYAFPAKPRNQWEIGIKVGVFAVSGDVRDQLFLVLAQGFT